MRWERAILLAAALAGLLAAGCRADQETAADPGRTAVVDPGHGGWDQGSSGTRTGISEAQLNLEVALLLRGLLEEAGFTVVMTRDSGQVAYDPGSGLSRKTQDMRRRAGIIADADPDLVVSIHMNKFPDGRYGGPQVFYQRGSDGGKTLAGKVQALFNANIEGSGRAALAGDYYILKAGTAPSVLVECGFLSNAGDEARLQTPEYRRRLAELIRDGILEWLEGN